MIDPNASLDRGARADKTFARRLIEWADPDSLAERPPGPTAGNAVEQAIAGALRSLAGKPVEVVFAGREAVVGNEVCRLPPLPPRPDVAAIAALRGLANSAALILRHHDAALHERLAPASLRARAAFDLMERCRCEALGARRFPGVARNLAAAGDDRLRRLGLMGGALAGQIPVAEALALVLGQDLGGIALSEVPASVVDSWRAWFAEKCGALPGLAEQAAFALAAGPVAEALAPHLPEPALRRQADQAGVETIVTLPTAAGDDEAAPAEQQAAPEPTAAVPYHAFSRAHDRVVSAAELAGADELRRLRRRLTADEHRRTATRLAHRLQRRLWAQQRRAWEFDREEGLLDAARLARVVTTPGTPLSFKAEKEAAFPDTVVALLIDNSGSMRGRSIELATLAADIIAQALERCGVRTEVLGFTTATFRGGDSFKDWARAGRPAHPGRLCDLLHIVYKDADTPYRRARLSLAAALKPDLLKENVDGEALEWAAARLAARPERRRVLIVLSDGAPADQATLMNNEPLLLDAHLRRVIAGLERRRQIDLRAIGIGHDVRHYYRHAMTLSDARSLAPALIGELDQVLAPRRRARAQ